MHRRALCAPHAFARSLSSVDRAEPSLITPESGLDPIRSPVSRRVVMLLLYVVVLGGFCEGSARIFFAALPRYLGHIPGDHSDASWRLRWIERHRGPAEINFPFDVYDPVRGWALRPALRDLPVFDGKTLSSNSKGIRGNAEYSYRKSPEAPRIGVFGDSFTFGDEVSDEETFSHRLGQLLPGTEVLNFGVHGYGDDQALLYLQQEGMKYHPDLVILGFVFADVERNVLAFRDYAKPRFVLARGKLVLENTPVPSIDDVLRAERYRLRFVDAVTILYQEMMWRSGIAERHACELTTAILEEMRRTVEAAGGRMLAVYLPVVDEINDASPGLTKGEQYFFGSCRADGLDCVSARPALLAERSGKDPLIPGKHWPPDEHLVVAEVIRAHVVEHHLLPRAH